MNDLFPWEHTGSAAMEPGEDTDAAPEPPEPAVQPDGDPREMEQTTAPAEVEQPTSPPEPEPGAEEEDESASPPHGDPLRGSLRTDAGATPRAVARERPVARKEYYSIGEVSELVGLPAHVLRYWESQFAVLNPSKNRSGNRAYQRKEIKLILLVKHLLYDEKYTVEGAKAKLDQLRRGGTLQPQLARALDAESIKLLREELAQLRDLLTIA